MNKKKVLALVLAAAMTATMAAGCGTKEKEKKSDTVTLKTVSMFGGTDPNAKIYQDVSEKFMKDNENVTIEDDSQVSDEEWKSRVAADFAAGNEPDVLQFFTDSTADTLIATDKLVSLEEIQKEYPEYAQDSLDTALEAVQNTDGVKRAVPTTGYWEGLFCNTDLFEQYNLELPTDWDSLVKAIHTFKENGIIPIAVSLNNVPHYWIEHLMLYAAGAEEYTSVEKEAPEGWVKGLELFKELRDMGAFPEDTDTVDDAYVGQLFKDKKAAMQLDGSWYANGLIEAGLDDTTTVIAFPGVKDQKAEAGTIISGLSSGFYITKKAWDDPDKREAAVKFVEAQTSKETLLRYWGGNGVATCEVNEEDQELSPLGKAGLELSKNAKALCLPTDSRIEGEAYKTIVSGIVGVSTGTQDAKTLLDEALAMNAERNAK